MKENEIDQLIEVRNILIAQYNKLDGRGNPGTAVVLQRDVARLIEDSIKKIDNVLRTYVSIENKK